jgi:hypothetical protein
MDSYRAAAAAVVADYEVPSGGAMFYYSSHRGYWSEVIRVHIIKHISAASDLALVFNCWCTAAFTYDHRQSQSSSRREQHPASSYQTLRTACKEGDAPHCCCYGVKELLAVVFQHGIALCLCPLQTVLCCGHHLWCTLAWATRSAAHSVNRSEQFSSVLEEDQSSGSCVTQCLSQVSAD